MATITRAPRRRRRVLRAVGIVLALPILTVGAYVAYVFMDYHRLPDGAEQHSQNVNKQIALYEEQTVITWNAGFGASSQDYSFFMDGGEESLARSPEAVQENLSHMIEVLKAEDPDHILLQEVDTRATRSWNINELDFLRAGLPGYQNYFSRNYNSPYLLYPVRQPYGKNQSGLVTLSRRDIYRGERHSLPVETGYMKLLDLDRCYTITRVPTGNGHYLCLYNLHLSPDITDGAIASQQLEMLAASMLAEYRQGNFCVAGGDFSKDLLGHSDRVFGVTPEEPLNWAQPVDRDLIPDGLQLIESIDKKDPRPSCRSLDAEYRPGSTFVAVVDGYIVSNNVKVLDCRVIDDAFTASDHNPVKLTFQLTEESEERRYELGPYTAVPGL